MALVENLTTYENRSVAAWYGKLDGLFGAERTIFDIVTAKTPRPDMIDIGIGGGRTTKHMAAACNSYIGFDYAASMVDEARRTCAPSLNIIQADATHMKEFADASADFVLFSFNGIDSVPHEQRLQILREARRVCRSGGYFALSTHNLSVVKREFAYKGGLKGAARWLLTRLLNFPLSARVRRDHALLNDGVHRFGLKLYYVQPTVALQQLADAGFHSPRLFGFNTGIEIGREGVQDPFPYILCTAD